MLMYHYIAHKSRIKRIWLCNSLYRLPWLTSRVFSSQQINVELTIMRQVRSLIVVPERSVDMNRWLRVIWSERYCEIIEI